MTIKHFTSLLVALAGASSLAAQTTPPAAAGPDTLAMARKFMAQQKRAEAVELLTPFVVAHPQNGGAWLTLGNAHRQLGHLKEAADALTRASEFVLGPVPIAAMNLFGMYADSGRKDEAFDWMTRKLQGKVDLTTIAAIPGVKNLKGDPRFDLLFPGRIKYSPPFVESNARIIHEWRGEGAGDEFGWIARGVGDVDHDHVTDVTISATQNPPYGSARGIVYLYSGKSGALRWKVSGDSGASLGTSLEAAGDVDGDGIPDVVAGAPGINAALVLSGKDGRELLRLKGDSADGDLGASAAGVGDVDGDGRADIAAGTPSSHEGAGRVYLFSGKDGHRLATLEGERKGDSFGSSVSGANGTIVVGAVAGGSRTTGKLYVFHKLEAKPAFTAESDSTGAAFGGMFSSVIGDIDGDGVPDIYTSDFPNSAKGRATGRVYLYSGKTGALLRTITGEVAGEGFGIGAARTGDLDGDGRADLVVGSWQYGGSAWSGGRVEAISGKDGRILQSITGKVPGETLGFDAVGVGDVDGDGITDFLVTSAWSMVNGFRSGRTYIVAGTTKKRRE